MRPMPGYMPKCWKTRPTVLMALQLTLSCLHWPQPPHKMTKHLIGYRMLKKLDLLCSCSDIQIPWTTRSRVILDTLNFTIRYSLKTCSHRIQKPNKRKLCWMKKQSWYTKRDCWNWLNLIWYTSIQTYP